MTPEQKQRIEHEISNWRNARNDHSSQITGDRMSALLQELVDAPEPEPVARVTGYYAGYLSIATVDGRVLPAGTALYAAQPAPSVLDELSGRFTDPAKLAADLPTWENGDDPLVGGGLISRGVVDFATVGIWPTKPTPSGPDGWRSAIAKEFPLYDEEEIDEDNHCCEWVMLQERKRLHKMIASTLTPATPPADVARDAWYGSNPPSLFQATAIYMALLEAAPNPQKLSDERILELFYEHATPDRWPFGFARAIDAAMSEKGQQT